MTIDGVQAAIEGSLPREYGGVTSWHGPEAGDWSWTFRAETGGQAPATLRVKIPRWEEAADLSSALAAGPQADTEGEFRALEEIAAAVASSGDPGLAAVVPVAYIREVNAIVTEELRANPLHTRLRGRRAETAGLFRRIGCWLHVFHGIGSPDEGSFDPGEAARFTTLAGDRGGALSEAASAVVAAAGGLSDRPQVAVATHGDFSMANILVTIDDRIAVVDPNRYRDRPTKDFAHLLTEARLGRRQLLTSGLARRRSTVESWAAAMVEGYPGIDRRMLSYDRAAAAVDRWADVEDGLSGPARAGLIPARRLLRSEAFALLEGL